MKPHIFGLWQHPSRASASFGPPEALGIRDPVARSASLLGKSPYYAQADGVSCFLDGHLLDPDTGTDLPDPARQLLSAYRQAGDNLAGFLTGILGEFAVAVLDATQGRLLLAVDRVGLRSLSYATGTHGAFVFGTSTKWVAEQSDGGRRLNPQSLFDYVHFHMVPSPDTAYVDVLKLPPGHFVCADRQGFRATQRYWTPQFPAQRHASLQGLTEELHSCLDATVQSCSPDSRTGAFLSGGLDSSSLVGALSRQQQAPVKTFSIGFDAEGFDESKYARATVEKFGAQAQEINVTPKDIVDTIPLIAQHYDEPFGNSSAVPTYVCARLAKEHGIDQLIAGDGGDELFAGNPHYTRQALFEYYQRLPNALRRRILEPMTLGLLPEDAIWPLGKLRSYVEQARIPLPTRLHSWNYVFREPATKIFSADLLRSVRHDHPERTMERAYLEAGETSTLNKLLFFDWKFVLADTDIRKVSQMCAVAGVDVRYPLLDHRMIDFSLAVPDQLKIRGQELRFFFKQAMRGFLPELVINKPKHGFGLPFGVWLKSNAPLRDLILSALDSLDHRGLFADGFLDGIVRDQLSGHASYYGYVIWDLAMLECWLQEQQLSL